MHTLHQACYPLKSTAVLASGLCVLKLFLENKNKYSITHAGKEFFIMKM